MYTITNRGIEKAKGNETETFETWEAVSAEWKRRTAVKPLTTKQKEDKWFAIHGVPSNISRSTLDAKLAAIKRAEKIENGPEEL